MAWPNGYHDNCVTQEGLIRGNDPYLYGEKVKAYLIEGAKQNIGGFTEWPNPQAGWGALCVEESFPKL